MRVGLIIIAMTVLCLVGVTGFVHSQQQAQEPVYPELKQAIDQMSAKIDALEQELEKNKGELNAKLDRILINQENILKELNIVKVRATR